MIINYKKRGIITFLSILLMFCMLTAGLIMYAENIGNAFKLPSMEEAVIDIEGIDLDGNYGALILNGEWEFFYNRWIITDDLEDDLSDGYIEVPSRWTGKEFMGVRLPREGYASYRMVIKNPSPGDKLICSILYYPNAYRTYINGNLTAVSGTMSRSIKGTFATAEPTEIYYYEVTDEEELVVVVELSATRNGGLVKWPEISTEAKFSAIHHWFGPLVFFVAIGFMVPVLIVVIALNSLRINKNKNYAILIMVVVLLIRYIFSYDVFYRLINIFPCIDYVYILLTTYLGCFILFLSLIYVLYLHNILVTCNYKKFAALLIVNVLSAIMCLITHGTWYMSIFLSVPFITILYYIYQVSLAYALKRKYAGIYLILITFVFISYTLEALELTGLAIVNIAGVVSVGCMIIMLTVLMVYLVQFKDSIIKSRRAMILEKEISDVKNRALREQIKPHFISNMMTNIQDLYHINLSSGDSALSKFSKHLRLHVDSRHKDMVTFDEELDNIQNYFDLENIRNNGKLKLLFDIGYTDFSVPILSLQPLIENAIKYAEIDKKDNGYILIKSYEEKGKIFIEVIDNGKGFDKNKIRENSTGLRNITERLKYSLNAEVIISSVIGERTVIRIVIPKEKRRNEDNSN